MAAEFRDQLITISPQAMARENENGFRPVVTRFAPCFWFSQIKRGTLLIAGALMLAGASRATAANRICAELCPSGAGFRFPSVPPPANNDAATKAKFRLVDGEHDGNSGELTVLQDGRMPTEEDEPAKNFFFRAGSDGGRIGIDLGRVVSINMVCTYSWHDGTRADQVYRLYAATGNAKSFNAAPLRGTDPEACGWQLIARVDTRQSEGDDGDQHGVAIADPSAGTLGSFRHLLLEVTQTEDRDAFGNTFYSEIDVIDAAGPPPTTEPMITGKSLAKSFAAEGRKYAVTIDATAAPDLMDWAEQELRPVVVEWYPKLAAMLASDGFAARSNLTLRFRNDLGDTPAAASGGRINLNSEWFRRERNGEARGAVVHELIHVVQNYDRAPRINPQATSTPGWLVEGIADYIRWYLFEPETKGAEIRRSDLSRAHYDASYRITGNFLNWVTQNHDRDIVRKLNAAARAGKYQEQLWLDWTGKSLPTLNEAWRQSIANGIQAAAPKSDPRQPDTGAK